MPILHLTDPVKYLKGVGPARAEIFAELGVRTVGDLPFYFPRDLSHMPGREPTANCRKKADAIATVGGTLRRCRWHGQRWKPVFSCLLADDSAQMDVTWFNAA